MAEKSHSSRGGIRPSTDDVVMDTDVLDEVLSACARVAMETNWSELEDVWLEEGGGEASACAGEDRDPLFNATGSTGLPCVFTHFPANALRGSSQLSSFW